MAKRFDEQDAPLPPAEVQVTMDESKGKTEKLPLEKLALATGHAKQPHVQEDGIFDAQHLAAAVRHGWTAYTYYKGEEVLLSQEDYLQALEAAQLGKVHPPAHFRLHEQEEAKKKSRDHAKHLAEKKGA